MRAPMRILTVIAILAFASVGCKAFQTGSAGSSLSNDLSELQSTRTEILADIAKQKENMSQLTLQLANIDANIYDDRARISENSTNEIVGTFVDPNSSNNLIASSLKDPYSFDNTIFGTFDETPISPSDLVPYLGELGKQQRVATQYRCPNGQYCSRFDSKGSCLQCSNIQSSFNNFSQPATTTQRTLPHTQSYQSPTSGSSDRCAFAPGTVYSSQLNGCVNPQYL